MISAIILAGGLGTRLRTVVSEVPKPLAPISSRPFLEYLMDYWIDQGVGHIILAVGYRADQIIRHFGYTYRSIPIEYSVEIEPLGTGGGLLLAANKLPHGQSHFLLLNGDTYFEVNLSDLIQTSASSKADWVFSLLESDDKERYTSIKLGEANRIISLENRSKDFQFSGYVNGGVYWVSRTALDPFMIEVNKYASLENEIFPMALKSKQKMIGLVVQGRFIDIGVPEDYKRANDNFFKNANSNTTRELN